MSIERTLTAYIGRQFIARFVGLLLFFVVVLQVLDLLNKSDDLVENAGGGWPSIWRYLALHTPQIASQFTPFAALLAIVMTLAQLSLRSEIVIMRSAGLSVTRVLTPIGVMCAGVALAHFAFQELVVTRASEKLAYWEANRYAPNLPPDDGSRANIRIAFGAEFIHASSAVREPDRVLLKDVTINTLDPRGLIAEKTEAASAEFRAGVWRLYGAKIFEISAARAVNQNGVVWRTALQPEDLFNLSLEPDRTQLATLVKKIGELKKEGADTQEATTSLLSRFSRPLATLVMPLLGAVAGFGVSRQGNQLARAAVGGGLGFSYFVAENLMLALGKLGVAPALVGAFFPFMVYLVVGFAIILAMEA